MKRKIWVTEKISLQLRQEFEVHSNTILWALKFYTHSDTSKKIRLRAVELMKEVNVVNEQLIKEYDND